LAALYARQDKAPEALSAAEDALKVDPRNKEANRILGSVLSAYAEQRQPARPGDDVGAYGKRATRALEIARGDGTGDLSIDLALAKLYLDQDAPPTPSRSCVAIVDEQPQYAEGSVLLADAQEAAGAPDAAAETLNRLLEDQAAVLPRARAARGAVRASAPLAAGGGRVGACAGAQPAEHRSRGAPREPR